MPKFSVSQVIENKYYQCAPEAHSYHFEQKETSFSIKVARSIADKLEAYKLIYQIYHEKGFIGPKKNKSWYSIFDASPATTTIIVKKAHEVVGCLTMIFDSALGLPADELFKEDLDLQRLGSQKIVEIVSLGIKKDVRGASKIFKKLFDVNLYFSYFFHGAEDCIITVNPNHAKFYEKKMGYKRLSEPRFYDKVNGAPAVLMLINGKEIIESKSNSFFEDFDCDKISNVFNFSLNDQTIDEETFLKHFGNKPEFFEHDTYKRVKYFEKQYPDLFFNGKTWEQSNLDYSFR